MGKKRKSNKILLNGDINALQTYESIHFLLIDKYFLSLNALIIFNLPFKFFFQKAPKQNTWEPLNSPIGFDFSFKKIARIM